MENEKKIIKFEFDDRPLFETEEENFQYFLENKNLILAQIEELTAKFQKSIFDNFAGVVDGLANEANKASESLSQVFNEIMKAHSEHLNSLDFSGLANEINFDNIAKKTKNYLNSLDNEVEIDEILSDLDYSAMLSNEKDEIKKEGNIYYVNNVKVVHVHEKKEGLLSIEGLGSLANIAIMLTTSQDYFIPVFVLLSTLKIVYMIITKNTEE